MIRHPQDGTCRFKKGSVGATDSGYSDLPHGDEAALKEALATVGPISIAIDGQINHAISNPVAIPIAVDRRCPLRHRRGDLISSPTPCPSPSTSEVVLDF